MTLYSVYSEVMVGSVTVTFVSCILIFSVLWQIPTNIWTWPVSYLPAATFWWPGLSSGCPTYLDMLPPTHVSPWPLPHQAHYSQHRKVQSKVLLACLFFFKHLVPCLTSFCHHTVVTRMYINNSQICSLSTHIPNSYTYFSPVVTPEYSIWLTTTYLTLTNKCAENVILTITLNLGFYHLCSEGKVVSWAKRHLIWPSVPLRRSQCRVERQNHSSCAKYTNTVHGSLPCEVSCWWYQRKLLIFVCGHLVL